MLKNPIAQEMCSRDCSESGFFLCDFYSSTMAICHTPVWPTLLLSLHAHLRQTLLLTTGMNQRRKSTEKYSKEAFTLLNITMHCFGVCCMPKRTLETPQSKLRDRMRLRNNSAGTSTQKDKKSNQLKNKRTF